MAADKKSLKSAQKKTGILWYTMAFMAFSTVWGFGNIIIAYNYFGGLKSIVVWAIVFAIYFIPYSLMAGELGSAFKDEGGGVSSWINATMGGKLAYFAGWTYWVVHMPYISQKPSGFIISASWIIYQDNRVSEMSIRTMQLISLAIFIVIMLVATRGFKTLVSIATLAGTSMFVMSMLFIVMMIAAPALTGKVNAPVLNAETLTPDFSWALILNLSILVFGVGGCEKISPYVNKMRDPAKDFSRGMIALVVMVGVTALLGTVALSMMFDGNAMPKDFLTNATYQAFMKVGQYYGLGSTFMIIYALCALVAQVSIMIISIDAPLRILIESTGGDYIPSALKRQNKYGVYINGYKLIAAIIIPLLILPMLGIGSVDDLVRWLIKLNSTVMPLRYLWVFVAYIALKKAGQAITADYRFTRSQTLGYIAGGWCFFVTLMASILGMYSEDTFQFVMNVLTPVILIGLGLIMPALARREKRKTVGV
ncbi:transporter [Boudabousia liubingyangii]|uniref:Transporter n=1 Tax=Boudabousia liubingyangii TaxID=1921764 RepID=A0A1Q5PJL0_9ACTO|nr:amino acid permease [Boudabousia liubingyangii]OKL46131.1 transporter [Boudabousia liubingyangii]